MKRRRVQAAIVLTTLSSSAAFGVLTPGDLAIIGFNADNPDQIAVVALNNIPAGEMISITDNGWFSAGGFRANEQTATYTVQAGGISAGTVLTLAAGVPGMSGSFPLFSTDGDQALMYQGSAATPTFIYAFNFDGATWAADATTAQNSALPPGVENANVAVPESGDNAIFNTSALATGTKDQWLAAIANTSNWSTSGSFIDLSALPATLSVTGSGGPADPPPPPPVPTPVAIIADGIIGAGNEAPLVGATQLPTPGSLPPGDGFQIFQRGVNDGLIPFALLDDSLIIFPGDTQGIIRNGDTGAFFGVTDLINGEPLSEINPGNGTGTAEFNFNVAGMTDIQIAIDMAAMGDFDTAPDLDIYDFTYSLDGAAFQSLFTSSIDEAGALNYLLEGGSNFNLNDPLLMNGIVLSNIFQTLTANVTGIGNVLTLRFFASTDGGTEAFAFRNIEVTSAVTTGGPNGAIPEPTTGALALAGLAMLATRRQRRQV